ncbi:MAG: polysaccharide pyruvyl transferase family protein [Kangiella sp.]|nr:polysaccharide pyruvyl transferase family protein [Kangiella sp.]
MFSKKPKIGLVGYFGWGNFGDELFIKVHKQYLSENFDLEVVHDKLAEPYFSKKKLQNLSKFDGFLIGGGDLLNPRAVSSLYWREEYFSKPVFIHGLGCPVTYIKESKSINYYKQYFSNDAIKHICLRDIESKNYFDSIVQPKIETCVYPDPVFSLALPNKTSSNDEKILGVMLRSHRSLEGDYEHVRTAVEYAKKLGYRIKIIVGAFGELGKGDVKISNDFAKGEEVVVSDNLMYISSEISKCSLLLSMKFHGLVVGTMYNIPVIQLSSTQKNKNLFRYLERPDLLGNYQDENLYQLIPKIPAPIHQLVVDKLKNDSKEGYRKLLAVMESVY